MSPNILPEDQPRYVIDEGMPSEEVMKILSEEQERILQKLMKGAGHTLVSEERELIFRLEDKLKRETERVKSLRKLTVSDKPLDAFLSKIQQKSGNNKTATPTEGEETEEESTVPKTVRVVGFKPEEVVRRYLECWNQQKFGAEYDCFSRDFLATPRETYINARHTFYQQQMNSGGLRIEIGEIVSNDTFGVEAEVVATKIIQNGDRKPKEERDLYRLRLEKGRWVIFTVEPL